MIRVGALGWMKRLAVVKPIPVRIVPFFAVFSDFGKKRVSVAPSTETAVIRKGGILASFKSQVGLRRYGLLF